MLEAAKIKRRPQGQVKQPAEPSLLPWSLKKPVTVTLKYRGGSVGWVEVKGRGRVRHYPGVTAVHDILMDFLGHPRGETW